MTAPFTAGNSEYQEYMGLEQSGFAWFGDAEQFGPDDEDCILPITVSDTGLPLAPTFLNVEITGGLFVLEWNTISEATHYGIFRRYVGPGQAPVPVMFSPDTIFVSTDGVGNPVLNPAYMIRAYVPGDSSEFSTSAGEFDYELP